jgi:3-mercaptopyruvate sulfurtransferase SseA
MRNKRVWLLLGFILAALPLSFHGCGTEYDEPSTTKTDTALISPATLKAWMDAGLVNGTGYDRVVILDVNSSTTYNAGHINGARWLDSSRISQNRVEGPTVTYTEVATGARMDELITELGITQNTTIVFTGSSYTNPCRAYFTFRYWGFPKNRLKVLDGLHNNVVGYPTWRISYPSDWGTVTAPPAAATTYRVTDNGTLRNDLRVSLSEMIDYAEGRVPNALAIDVRGITAPVSYNGTPGGTGGSFPSPSTADYKVFEGHINGAKLITYSDLYYASATGLLFKDTDTVKNYFTDASVGLDSTKTAYIYCRVGYMGAVAFFALDGILGWPVAFYDGSWSQWGLLSGNAAMGGMLDPSSPWTTDISARSEVIVYNDPAARPIEVLAYNGTTCTGTNTGGTIVYNPVDCNLNPDLYAAPDSFATSGNQIEEDDRAYMKSGSGGSGGGGGGSGGC